VNFREVALTLSKQKQSMYPARAIRLGSTHNIPTFFNLESAIVTPMVKMIGRTGGIDIVIISTNPAKTDFSFPPPCILQHKSLVYLGNINAID